MTFAVAAQGEEDTVAWEGPLSSTKAQLRPWVEKSVEIKGIQI